MKKKALVLGCGRIGATMARDLAGDSAFQVSVVDVSEDRLRGLEKTAEVTALRADVRQPQVLRELAAKADIVLGALPSRWGLYALKAVLEAERPYVDISFMPEDPLDFDELAQQHNVTCVIDCGVSPGLSNMIVGYEASRADLERAVIYVGGLPRSRRWPFQYKAPFAPSDVIEEYTRPARMIERGEIVTKPALSGVECVDVDGIGTLEAFYTDGLRTLLRTTPVRNLVEKTLRYPGHAELMRVFRATGLFRSEPIVIGDVRVRPVDVTAALVFPKWRFERGEEEFTVLRAAVEGERDGHPYRASYELYDEYDHASDTSSMARTTALPCTIVARMIALGRWSSVGVNAPEQFASCGDNFQHVVEGLRARGVELTRHAQSPKR